ncbi:hypothetical protein GALL_384430 [mine drainage metagenome]|uniref:Uncharacterized protein n=1 Tax=mine drainage metagenome TaxID=410659 RepID=A0A1J5QIN1_9ZZZZ
MVGRDVQIRLLALEDELRLGQRRAASPSPRHPRVARRRERSGTGVGIDEHGVLVDPAHPALGLGPLEAAGHPRPGLEVELARHVGVGAAAGERHQGAAAVGTQDLGAVPYPALALGGGERVEVEEHVPVGVVGAVRLERRPPPEPALVRRVAPQVVVQLPGLGDRGDLRVGVEHREDALAQVVETRSGERARRLVVAGAHPRKRVVALDVLEPGVRIGGCRGVRVHAGHDPWPLGRRASRARPGPRRGAVRPRR